MLPSFQTKVSGSFFARRLFLKRMKKFILIKNKIEVYTLNQERSSEREGDGIMNNKNKSLADKIPKRVWLLISFAVAMLFWYILSIIPSTSRAFQNVVVVCQSIKTMIDRGVLGTDILSSLISVVARLCAWFCNRTSGCNPYGMV